MFKEHTEFQPPDDEHAKIWRYVDFAKFVSLLEKQSLFFARLDKLGDPYEGMYSKVNVEIAGPVYAPHVPADQLPALLEQLAEHRRWTKEHVRKHTVVSCWHLNEHESDAMWKLYLPNGEGIAIQSTYRRLADAFAGYHDRSIYIGKLIYVDYNSTYIPESNMLSVFMHKRVAFEHERELRAMICDVDGPNGSSRDGIAPIGIYVPVDLGKLIQRVYLAPTSPRWLTNLVQGTMNRYDIRVPVLQSVLSEDLPY